MSNMFYIFNQKNRKFGIYLKKEKNRLKFYKFRIWRLPKKTYKTRRNYTNIKKSIVNEYNLMLKYT